MSAASSSWKAVLRRRPINNLSSLQLACASFWKAHNALMAAANSSHRGETAGLDEVTIDRLNLRRSRALLAVRNIPAGDAAALGAKVEILLELVSWCEGEDGQVGEVAVAIVREMLPLFGDQLGLQAPSDSGRAGHQTKPAWFRRFTRLVRAG